MVPIYFEWAHHSEAQWVLPPDTQRVMRLRNERFDPLIQWRSRLQQMFSEISDDVEPTKPDSLGAPMVRALICRTPSYFFQLAGGGGGVNAPTNILL